MELIFEWDSKKAQANLLKHDVSFEEAATIFGDALSLTVPDPDHSSAQEERFITSGVSVTQQLIVVVHCDREETVRLISARRATRHERQQYEEGS